MGKAKKMISGMTSSHTFIRSIKNLIFLGWVICFLSTTSCRHDDKKHGMISILRCMEIDEGYHYCHNAGQESCYLNFGGKRYLKKERLLYNRNGHIDSAQVFRSEGVVGYSSAELAQDTLFLQHMGWNISGVLEIKEDSVVTPMRAKIHEVVDVGSTQQIYALKTMGDYQWMYVIEINK